MRWDDAKEIRKSVDPEALERLREICETYGWICRLSDEGYEIFKQFDAVQNTVYMTVDFESLGRGFSLEKILTDSARTFHSVAAACETALAENETCVYLYDEFEAVRRLWRYLDCTIDIKQEMLKICSAVHKEGLELIKKRERKESKNEKS